MKTFLAFLAIRSWIALGTDAINVYAQASIPEDEPQYIAVDQQMVDWWWGMYKETITTDMVMRILMAVQGHPRAGQLWGDNVEGYLGDLGFVPLEHEQFMYLGKYAGNQIICCRKSDEFLFGGENEEDLQGLVTAWLLSSEAKWLYWLRKPLPLVTMA
jgi:hypothetical protein